MPNVSGSALMFGQAVPRREETVAASVESNEVHRRPRARGAAIEPEREHGEEQRRQQREVTAQEVRRVPGGEEADLHDDEDRRAGGDADDRPGGGVLVAAVRRAITTASKARATMGARPRSERVR